MPETVHFLLVTTQNFRNPLNGTIKVCTATISLRFIFQMVYFMMLSTEQIIQLSMTGWLVNNGLERIQKEAVAAPFILLFWYMDGWSEENHEKSQSVSLWAKIWTHDLSYLQYDRCPLYSSCSDNGTNDWELVRWSSSFFKTLPIIEPSDCFSVFFSNAVNYWGYITLMVDDEHKFGALMKSHWQRKIIVSSKKTVPVPHHC